MDEVDDGNHVSSEQARLRPMIDAVQDYVAAHPDSFGHLRWENSDPVRIVVSFTHGVDQHERALRALVDEPARLDVVHATHTQLELRAIADQVLAMTGPHDGFLMGGPIRDRVYGV